MEEVININGSLSKFVLSIAILVIVIIKEQIDWYSAKNSYHVTEICNERDLQTLGNHTVDVVMVYLSDVVEVRRIKYIISLEMMIPRLGRRSNNYRIAMTSIYLA